MLRDLIKQIDEALFELKEHAIHLYEMSQPQAIIRQRVRDLSEEIVTHLTKIILYGDKLPATVLHWCSEIDAWLDKCMKNKIKKSSKDRFPTSDELLAWLTDYYKTADDIEGIRFNVEKSYSYQGFAKSKITDEDLYNKIISIIKELCPLVANREHNKTKIEQIVSQYIIKDN